MDQQQYVIVDNPSDFFAALMLHPERSELASFNQYSSIVDTVKRMSDYNPDTIFTQVKMKDVDPKIPVVIIRKDGDYIGVYKELDY